jgi:D-sedoheptulose 7-phosphate isomerase
VKDVILSTLNEARESLDKLISNDQMIANIEVAANAIIKQLEAGGRVYSCGNGGSMSDAMHFAEELTGRYRDNRKGLAATAISDPGHISCVANDFGYEYIFSRYLEAHADKTSCLFAISTSGTSKNVVKAAEYANEIGIPVIALTGKENKTLGELATIEICTPGGQYADRVQELHIKVIHIIIELIERHFYPELYS